ncbi:MAG TPA: sodium:proton antiporter [Myxococcales bacterium]|nr:sodium:proton antiporter [Myxococcales bacterium]
MSQVRRAINFVQEFSIPLILGVIAGLIHANVAPESYQHMIHLDWTSIFGSSEAHAGGGGAHGVPYWKTVHFLINDIFMALFFGIAAKEITESVLPGGALNPPSKAVNPLLGTIGGIVGPAGFYLICVFILVTSPEQIGVASGVFGSTSPEHIIAGQHWSDATQLAANGWGIPTATDIALAWLFARLIFGNKGSAVGFLLLLAVADDAIGLVIIAVFYPSQTPEPVYMLLAVAGMAVAFGMRKFGVKNWHPYILIAGPLSWCGFYMSHLHPALALVPIVPFLPGPKVDTGLYEPAEDEEEEHHAHDALHSFEHDLKLFVDVGLFFFAWANAGVQLGGINIVTWIVLGSLIFGKTIGITFFSWLGTVLGFPLPDGMKIKHLVVASIIAGLGLTVALFVSGEAFKGPAGVEIMGAAKMGSLMTVIAGFLALGLGKIWGVKQDDGEGAPGDQDVSEAAH